MSHQCNPATTTTTTPRGRVIPCQTRGPAQRGPDPILPNDVNAPKEARKLGLETSADRAFTHEEFAQMLDLTAIGDSLQSLRHMAML
eukprot:jgi/Psemu1/33124/gm1.33124_g